MKIGILGYGEVGQAVAGLYESVVICDPFKGHDDDMSNLDLLNVCIPYSNTYVDVVSNKIHDGGKIQMYLQTINELHQKLKAIIPPTIFQHVFPLQ